MQDIIHIYSEQTHMARYWEQSHIIYHILDNMKLLNTISYSECKYINMVSFSEHKAIFQLLICKTSQHYEHKAITWYSGHKAIFPALLILLSQCGELEETAKLSKLSWKGWKEEEIQIGSSYPFMILRSSYSIIIFRSIGCLQKK